MDLFKAAMAGPGQGGLGATASGSNSGGGSSSTVSRENAAYLEAHPGVRAALNDFVSALLLEKPEVRPSVRLDAAADGVKTGLCASKPAGLLTPPPCVRQCHHQNTTQQQDVYEFAARHFSRAHTSHKDKLLRPLVICGPSGVGKGTLLNLLFQEFGGDFGFSVSHVRACLLLLGFGID